MTTPEMEQQSPGTVEAPEAPSPAPRPAADTSDKVAETLARLRAESTPPDGDARSFVEKLSDAGVEATVKDLPATAEVEDEEPEEAAEPAPSEADPFEELIEKASATRDSKVNAAHDLQARLEAKGMKPSLAKAMAHHGSRKDAEEFLTTFGNDVESEEAGQPALVESEAFASAKELPALAEVQSQLEELSGEETATAVTGYLSQILERLQAVEGTAQHSAEVVQAKEKSELRTTAQQVTGELQGQFPQLVRDGNIDPAVRETAAAMFDRGHTQGDLAASIRAAAFAVYGSQTAQPRQTQIDSTREPELSAPDDVRDFGHGPVSKHEEQQILTEVYRKFREKPDQRKAALGKARRMIDRRNATSRK
jgi:hypothetical protein